MNQGTYSHTDQYWKHEIDQAFAKGYQIGRDSGYKDGVKDAHAKQEQGEPVAWRYKPVREDNPRWEYTTQHPLDMGDGYLRPSLVEYCKCIEPLYATEKPKLMLEKFREMKDLLEDTVQQEPATKEQIREAIVFNLPLYTTPQQRKPLTDEQITAGGKALAKLHADSCGLDFDDVWKYYAEDHKADAKAAIEAAHGIKE